MRAALAAHPEAALRDTQAPTLDDQRRFHEMTGFVPTRLALAAAVENLQKEQLGRQALHEHGYGPHVQGMRTAAAVSACPLVLERPHGPGAAAAPAQPLPVGTWGVGLAPRAAAVAAPAVAVPAAPTAASAAPEAPPAAAAIQGLSRKEKDRLRKQIARREETEKDATERRTKIRMQVSGKRKSETEAEKNQRNERQRALRLRKRQQSQQEEGGAAEVEGSAGAMEEGGGCGGASAGGGVCPSPRSRLKAPGIQSKPVALAETGARQT